MITYHIYRKKEGADQFKIYIHTDNGDIIPHKNGRNYDIKQLNSFIQNTPKSQLIFEETTLDEMLQ